jgi:hypothetical protein
MSGKLEIMKKKNLVDGQRTDSTLFFPKKKRFLSLFACCLAFKSIDAQNAKNLFIKHIVYTQVNVFELSFTYRTRIIILLVYSELNAVEAEKMLTTVRLTGQCEPIVANATVFDSEVFGHGIVSTRHRQIGFVVVGYFHSQLLEKQFQIESRVKKLNQYEI